MIGVVRHDQDWAGFGVVVGILVVFAALAFVDAWWAGRKVHRRSQLVEPIEFAPWQSTDGRAVLDDIADLTDHEPCVSDDCALILCYCRTVDAPCEGTVEPGCCHSDAFVCDEHRLGECQGCREDARWDAAVWPR